MLPHLSSPVIFAHRGSSTRAPENTLTAFQLAVEEGALALELDVQLTADKQVVVIHDETLDRTTDGVGAVSAHTLAEIKQLQVVANGPSSLPGEIPTLDEVLDAVPPHIILNIELKNLSSPLDSLPARTAQVIQKHQAQDRVLISSFNGHALRGFQRQIPEVPCGRLLYLPLAITLHRVLPALTSRYRSIHIPFRSLSQLLISDFQGRGLKVFVYTLNRPEDILRAVEMGADGFFTDDPLLAASITAQRPGNE